MFPNVVPVSVFHSLCGWITFHCMVDHVSVIHSFIDSHLDYFHLLTTMNYAGINIHVQDSAGTYIFICLGWMLGVELLGRRVILCWSIWETARLFAQGAAPFDIPPALCEWGPVSLHHPETLTDSPAVPTGNLPAWSITVETCILQWDSVLKKRQLHCSPSPHTLLSSLVSDSVCNSGLALSLMPLFFAYCFALFLWSFFFWNWEVRGFKGICF